VTDRSGWRSCEAVIDLAAIRANYELACRLAPDSRALAVIKADAYGHGAVQVAETLRDMAPMFAVGFIDEAVRLWDAGITEPVLLLQGASDVEELALVAAHGGAVVVHEEGQVATLVNSGLASPVQVWLKIDTGMHRLGIAPARVAAALARLGRSKNVAGDVVLCTHLAGSDVPGDAGTRRQIELFDACCEGTALPGSIANSGAVLAYPESYRDWNRPGYMLYGGCPFVQDLPQARALAPAMTLRTAVIAVREVAAGESVGYGGRWTAERPSRVATAAIGYADGYPRHAPNGTRVLVGGKAARLAGTVSMDLVTVDVTGLGHVAVGDEVTLWGPGLSVDEVARRAGTIGYELLTSVSARVPRRYKGWQGG
jgi:alanine racemase